MANWSKCPCDRPMCRGMGGPGAKRVKIKTLGRYRLASNAVLALWTIVSIFVVAVFFIAHPLLGFLAFVPAVLLWPFGGSIAVLLSAGASPCDYERNP